MQSCLLRDLGFDAERTTEILRQHYPEFRSSRLILGVERRKDPAQSDFAGFVMRKCLDTRFW
jgi:hypothetical protein